MTSQNSITNTVQDNDFSVNRRDIGTAVLDVYEEDTSFTPVLDFGGGTTGITYGTQEGDYARIGSVIFFRIDIVLTSKGSSVGTAAISGLPGTLISGPTAACYVDPAVVTFAAAGTDIAASLNAGPVVQFSGVGTTINRIGLDDADFANTSEVHVSGWYESST
jgi:hypothetical protein